MNASRLFQRIVCVCLLSMLVAGPAWAQDVLELIPPESLIVVRINQFDHTLSQVDKFLAGIAPMGIQMPIRAHFGQVLGNAELPGVDMNGTFAAFAVAQEDSYGGGLPPIYPGVLIPVSDYDKFISGNPNLGEPDEHGVSAIAGPGQSGATTPWLVAIKTGQHALVTMGTLYPQVLQYQEMMGLNPGASGSMSTLAGDLVEADAKTSRQSPVWIYGDVARASKIFKPLVMGKYAQFKETIAEKMKEDVKTPVMDMGAIFDMYGVILEMILDQTQSVSLVIDPKPEVLRFSKTVCAVPGSDLAGMLASDSTGQPNRLIGFAEDGAGMSFVGTIGDSWKTMYIKSIDLLSVMLDQNLTAETTARMKKMTTDMINVLEGPVAFTFNIQGDNKPPFDMTYVFGVKDAVTFKSLLKDSTDLFMKSGITDLYKGMGIEMDYSMTLEATTYRGISIDSARLTMTSTQPDSAMGKALDGMYGGGFDYRWAVVDKTCVVAVGGHVDSQIHRMIDRLKAGTPQAMGSEMREAFSVLPDADKADFVMTYNYARVIAGVLNSVKAMGEEVPTIDVKTTSHLSMAGWGGQNRARFDMAVPKQHVRELVSVFTSLSQAGKAQQGGSVVPGSHEDHEAQ